MTENLRDLLGATDDLLADDPLAGDPLADDPLAALPGAMPRRRVDVDKDNVERGLAQLVLTVVELLRQLMERQALRRVEGGNLTDDEVERLGTTLMLLEQRMRELRELFGLEEEDLNLDIGVGNLL
jgi:hypothetical protein